MTIAILAFIVGFLFLLFGADKYNPSRDLIGFGLIIGSFIYVCLQIP